MGFVIKVLIIISALILIVFGVLFAVSNAENTASLDLVFMQPDSVNVALLVMVPFFLGVVISLLFTCVLLVKAGAQRKVLEMKLKKAKGSSSSQADAA